MISCGGWEVGVKKFCRDDLNKNFIDLVSNFIFFRIINDFYMYLFRLFFVLFF